MKTVSWISSLLLFGLFSANVVAGAARWGVFLSDVQEMLCLFFASLFFVVLILVLERDRKSLAESQET